MLPINNMAETLYCNKFKNFSNNNDIIEIIKKH